MARHGSTPWRVVLDARQPHRKAEPMFVATINVPGYLPMDDDPPVFETPRDAWEYLAEQRRRDEDEFWQDVSEDDAPYSETVDTLDAYASAAYGPDVVYGDTPGYDGDHDLGLAYCVTFDPDATTDDDA